MDTRTASSHIVRVMTALLVICPALLALAPAPAGAQSGSWEWRHPLPAGVDLWGLTSVGGDTLVAVGDNGTILRSVDRGASWRRQRSGTADHLLGVASASPYVVAVGINRTVLESRDGGVTWSHRSIDATAYYGGAAFADERTGVIVGGTLLPSSVILRTTDAGESWAQVESPTTVALNDVTFIDARRGWAAGDAGVIVRTTDGGATWQLQRRDTTFPTYALGAIAFGDSLTGAAAGERGRILSTTDGGVTWTQARSGGRTLNDLLFVAPREAIAVGELISYRTTDGGATWNGSGPTLGAVVRSDAGWIVGVGRIGAVHRLDAGASSWTQLSSRMTSIEMTGVAAVNERFAVVVGRSGWMLTTSDGGQSWTPLSGPNSRDLLSIDAADSLLWAIGGAGGEVRVTVDGGATFRSGGIGPRDVTDIDVDDAGHIWAAGLDGEIATSADSGASWSKLPIESAGTAPFGGIAVGGGLGVAVSRGGSIGISTDAGLTWRVARTGMGDLSRAYVFGRHSALVHGPGTVLRTDDAGATWRAIPVPSNQSILTSSFRDSLNGALALNGGELLRTSDGGATWRSEPTHVGMLASAKPVRGVSFADARTGYVVGENGMILRYVPPSGASVVLASSIRRHELLRIRPVPAKGRVVASVDGFDAHADVEVRVVDPQGRLALHERIPPRADGLVEIDLSSLAPGAYVVRLGDGRHAASAVVTVVR